MECDGRNLGSVGSAIARWAETLSEWRDRSHGRRALMALSDRSLKDIGVSRCEAQAEYDKPFWRGENWNRKWP